MMSHVTTTVSLYKPIYIYIQHNLIDDSSMMNGIQVKLPLVEGSSPKATITKSLKFSELVLFSWAI